MASEDGFFLCNFWNEFIDTCIFILNPDIPAVMTPATKGKSETAPSTPQTTKIATPGSILEHHQLPKKYARTPLSIEEMEYIQVGILFKKNHLVIKHVEKHFTKVQYQEFYCNNLIFMVLQWKMLHKMWTFSSHPPPPAHNIDECQYHNQFKDFFDVMITAT